MCTHYIHEKVEKAGETVSAFLAVQMKLLVTNGAAIISVTELTIK